MRQVIIYSGEDGYRVAECPSSLDALAREKQGKKLLQILGKQFKDILLHWKKTIFLFRKNDSKPLWLQYEEIAQDFRPGVCTGLSVDEFINAL